MSALDSTTIAGNSRFEIRQLVRCSTPDGPRIGEVVGLSENTLTVRYFGIRGRVSVSKRKAIPYLLWVGNRRRPQKLKTIYTEFFGGRPLRRMRTQRLRPLHKILKSHGIAYDPDLIGADDFVSLSEDSSYLTQTERKNSHPGPKLPSHLQKVLPGWLVSEKLPPSSRDPLGWQADAESLANKILPGLTVFTNRVGYFFFLPWAVKEINGIHGLTYAQRRELLNRMERALVLCEVLYHGPDHLAECYHQGQRMKRRLLADAAPNSVIPPRILKAQNSTGCYSLYRTAMRSSGFWEDDDEKQSEGYLPHRLTPVGEKLAAAFARRAASGKLFAWARDGSGARQKGKLAEWGEVLCFCDYNDERSEKRWFLEGFLFATGDNVEVVREARTRLSTLRSLQKERLLSASMDRRATAGIRQTSNGGGDFSETIPDDQLDDEERSQENGLNVDVLLHFYQHRGASGAAPFVSAAIYEMLALGLTAIWRDIVAQVRENGRTSLDKWVGNVTATSAKPAFWGSSVEAASRNIRMNERRLVENLLAGENSVELGVMLILKVCAHSDNLSLLGDLDLKSFVQKSLSQSKTKTVSTLLLELVRLMLQRHSEVSDRKGKDCWLKTDGTSVWKDDLHDVGLAFHSFRFRQLMSIIRDLHLNSADLKNA